jgi:hypothetical protein
MDQSDDMNEPVLDLVWGSREIAKEINRNQRQTFYLLETGGIPARKVGKIWVADRGQLRKRFLGEIE